MRTPTTESIRRNFRPGRDDPAIVRLLGLCRTLHEEIEQNAAQKLAEHDEDNLQKYYQAGLYLSNLFKECKRVKWKWRDFQLEELAGWDRTAIESYREIAAAGRAAPDDADKLEFVRKLLNDAREWAADMKCRLAAGEEVSASYKKNGNYHQTGYRATADLLRAYAKRDKPRNASLPARPARTGVVQLKDQEIERLRKEAEEREKYVEQIERVSQSEMEILKKKVALYEKTMTTAGLSIPRIGSEADSGEDNPPGIEIVASPAKRKPGRPPKARMPPPSGDEPPAAKRGPGRPRKAAPAAPTPAPAPAPAPEPAPAPAPAPALETVTEGGAPALETVTQTAAPAQAVLTPPETVPEATIPPPAVTVA